MFVWIKGEEPFVLSRNFTMFSDYISIQTCGRIKMKIQKKAFKRFVRRCSALYRWYTCYRRHVRMIEAELGDQLEAC